MKKTFGKAIQFMVLPLLLVASVVGCGKSNNNNNQQVGYGIINGQCYQNGTQNVVPYTHCNGQGQIGNGQYQYINGQCVVVGTNQIVDQSLCMNNGGWNNGGWNGGNGGWNNGGWNNGGWGNGGGWNNGGYPNYPQPGFGGYSQTCHGQYYISNGLTARIVWCNGYDCRGSFLFNYQTRTQVYCQ